MSDKIELDLHILADGTLSISAGKIPDAVHAKADKIVQELEKPLGGKTTVEQTRAGHGHVHTTAEDHEHHHH